MAMPPSKRTHALDEGDLQLAEDITVSSNASSASAALARSIFLYLGFMFRRPSKLFRPSRLDTWGGLRQLAVSANQSFSPSFVRTLLGSKSGALAVVVTILPPLVVNTSLGFLLFTSHSFFALSLARLPFFQRAQHQPAEHIDLHTLLQGPKVVPKHATLLSAVAGAGAGALQGMAFTPIENVVRLLKDSATSLTGMLVRFLRLPIRSTSPLNDLSLPSSPVEAVKQFFSTDTWRKSASWWSGWRWTVARDAVSYACFFAAFDITRRIGLRVRAFFGGAVSPEWQNFIALERKNEAPNLARLAQATTIVSGGITASLMAEAAGRPFRACQTIIQQAGGQPHPLRTALRERGIASFFRRQNIVPPDTSKSLVHRLMLRTAWRMAAVGPWGFGFLVWAWVGGEV